MFVQSIDIQQKELSDSQGHTIQVREMIKSQTEIKQKHFKHANKQKISSTYKHHSKQNQSAINNIRCRLTAIINSKIDSICQGYHLKTNHIQFCLNQALLEEWTSFLQEVIIPKTLQKQHSKNNQHLQVQNSTDNNNSHTLKQMKPLTILPKISEKQYYSNDMKSGINPLRNNRFLLHIRPNHIEVMSITDKIKKEKHSNMQIQINKYQIKAQKGIIRAYCSYTFINQNTVIMIGGCKQSNPNLKSKNILSVCLFTSASVNQIESHSINIIAKLPYGISSHSCILIKNQLYIIGGNKDHSIITKNCYKYNILTMTGDFVQDLHFPSASHLCISWKNRYIYKVGGIGDCFGGWDLSPYIQRYDVEVERWELINPLLRMKQAFYDSSYYGLLACSFGYIASRKVHSIKEGQQFRSYNQQKSQQQLRQEEYLIILGGFDFNKQGSNILCQLKLSQQNNQISKEISSNIEQIERQLEGQLEGQLDKELQQQIDQTQDNEEEQHEITSVGELVNLKKGGFWNNNFIVLHDNIYAMQVLQENNSGLTTKVVELANHAIQYY